VSVHETLGMTGYDVCARKGGRLRSNYTGWCAALRSCGRCVQARSSNGGFFQDNRQLDIVKVDSGSYGPANWIEE